MMAFPHAARGSESLQHPVRAGPDRAGEGRLDSVFEVAVAAPRRLSMKRIGIPVLASLLLTASAAAAQPNDAQIAAIVVTANQVDIDAGKLAASVSHNVDVKSFAERMVTDHTGVNKSAVDLVTKLKVTHEDNPTAQSLKAAGDQNLRNLKGLKRVAFDKAYVTHEVAYHQQVLDAMDQVLIPNAQNPELKALLVKVRPAFVAHLEHAKKIEASLAGKR